MKAVILAGGQGKRLRPLTNDRSKSMIEISGRPIIEWQIYWLRSHGIRNIVLCTGYMRESIIEYIGNGTKLDVQVEYAVEEEPLGTAGALKNSESLLGKDEPFLVMNGDILTNLDPLNLFSDITGDVRGVIAIVPLRSPYGVVDLNSDGSVGGFREKPILENNWINAGIYCLSPLVLPDLPQVGDLESKIFPEMSRDNNLRAIKYNNVKWRSIDSHKDIDEAQNEFRKE